MASPKKVSCSLVNDRGTWVIRGRVFNPEDKKTHNRSKSTGLKVQDHTKRKAEEILRETTKEWEKEANAIVVNKNPLFVDYINGWLAKKGLSLKANTVKSYHDYANKHIIPALGNIKMRDLALRHLQIFYKELLKDISVISARKVHVVISGAIMDAVRDGVVAVNFAQYVEFPKAEKFCGSAYNVEQVSQLLNAIDEEGEPLKAAITLSVCYGLRRSEVCGLRWSDIDFDDDTLTVQNTIVQNGRLKIEAEQTKTKRSNRTIALIAFTKQYLIDLKDAQTKAGMKLDKVCRWPDGREVRPDYLTRAIHRLQRRHNLPNARFHDMRHTAATLLSTRSTPKQVQEFLGHEDISTTMNVYTHLLNKERVETSNNMSQILEEAKSCSEKCSEIKNVCFKTDKKVQKKS